MTEANAYTKSFMRESLKSYNSAPITSLIYSNTIEEQKIAIKKIKKYADKDDFNKIRALFLNSRIISRKTWGEAENEIRRTEAQE